MRWLNPSAVLNFRKPSMDLTKESDEFCFVEPGVLRFIRNSSIFGKMSTAVRQANEKPEPDGLWFDSSSGDRIRTYDLQVMSPKSGAGIIDPQAPSFRVAFGSLVRRGQTINDYD